MSNRRVYGSEIVLDMKRKHQEHSVYQLSFFLSSICTGEIPIDMQQKLEQEKYLI